MTSRYDHDGAIHIPDAYDELDEALDRDHALTDLEDQRLDAYDAAKARRPEPKVA